MASKMADKIPKIKRFSVLLLSSVFILAFLETGEGQRWEHLHPTSEQIKKSMSDIIADSWKRVDEIDWIKQLSVNTAPFEVGYVLQIIQDKYRKMVDRYRSSRDLYKEHYLGELIVYLEEIEHGYWQLNHLINMAHEIERKYDVRTSIHSNWTELTKKDVGKKYGYAPGSRPDNKKPGHKPNKPKGFTAPDIYDFTGDTSIDINKFITTKQKYSWNLEYGWEIPKASLEPNQGSSKPLNETILANAPWTIKLLMLRDVEAKLKANPRRVGVEALIERQGGDDAQSIPTETPSQEDNDENNMRLKLFRLMYETVRDSDLKVKRAELIRQHYSNSTAFEVGYLMGEVQEKFDIINEFARTLEKFYDVWKPIEHINAYEQIANYAIQVNHLIDLVRTIAKNPN